jgi:Fe-S-cluster containining protein
MFNKQVVEPNRLDPDSKFKFACHPGVPCFTRCCSNIDIMLTPYDVLRLKKRLGISSEEFLEKYTGVREDEQSSHPYAYLKMLEGEDRLCPFLKNAKEGCGVYEDRPISCRYYPVGQTTMKKSNEKGEVEHDEFYFFVREEHCKGYDEDKQWTVDEFRIDQGAEHYDSMNRDWKEVLMRRNLPGQPKLDEKKQMMFFMASYDLDKFRRFIFNSRFLEMFEVDEKELGAIKEDDVALMNFGFRYIKFLMMMENTMKPNAEVLAAKLKELEEKQAAKAAESGKEGSDAEHGEGEEKE